MVMIELFSSSRRFLHVGIDLITFASIILCHLTFACPLSKHQTFLQSSIAIVRLHDEVTFRSHLFHLIRLCPDRLNNDVVAVTLLGRLHLVLVDHFTISVRCCLLKALECLNPGLTLRLDTDLSKVRLTLLAAKT